MQIKSLKIQNYRCIKEIKLENLSPITIFVGRNNTGKSAILEAITLITTGIATWFDALDKDILTKIISKRGGWNFVDMMIKRDEPQARIIASGKDLNAELIISHSQESSPEINDKFIYQRLNQYLEKSQSKFKQTIDRFSYMIPKEQKDTYYNILYDYLDWLRGDFSRLFKILITYRKSHNDTREFALIGKSEELENHRDIALRKLNDIISDRKPKIRPFIFHLEDIIRSETKMKSNALFLLDQSPTFFKELMKQLTVTGELVNLIKFLQKHIKYFKDLREVEGNYFIFLKGLREPVPLEAMGDGFRVNLMLLSAISTLKSGIILMEEPENNLHPGYMSLIANQIIKTATNGKAQYFISTHSMEFIQFLLEANSNLIKIVRLYRFEEEPDIDYEILDAKDALEEYQDLKMDLRGI